MKELDKTIIILREFKNIAPYALFEQYIQNIKKVGFEFQNDIQVVIKFPNNYGASIIYSYGSYGVELAVIHYNSKGAWNIDYTTHITNDVIGYLDKEELLKALQEIQVLREEN